MSDLQRPGRRAWRQVCRRRGVLLAAVLVTAGCGGREPLAAAPSATTLAPAVRTARWQLTPLPGPPMTCRAGSVVYSVNTGGRPLVAFGFDDGPWPVTTETVMTEFERRGLRATFFLIGAHLQKYQSIGRSIVLRGHEVGNHTLSHQYTTYAILSEVQPAADYIAAITGQRPRVFRSPGLMKGADLQAGLAWLGWCNIHASILTGDAAMPRPSAATICARFASSLRPGGIVLAHDGGGYHETTAAAVPCMLDYATSHGYQVVTISELLGQSVVAPFG